MLAEHMDDEVSSNDVLIDSSYNSVDRMTNVTRRTSPQSRVRQLRAQEQAEQEFGNYNDVVLRTTPRHERRSRPFNQRSKGINRMTHGMVLLSLAILCFYHVKSYRETRRTSLRNLSVWNYFGLQQVPPSTLNATQLTIPVEQGDQSDFIHIVHTRFMQNQPNLIDLGLARLELMRIFCIASLETQTSQNFLWVIRTDPNLNATLLEPLLELLKDHSHHLLIANNDAPNVQINELRSLDQKKVLSGDWEWAKRYMQLDRSYASRPVLETRLDADDGLHMKFIEHVQEEARQSWIYGEPSWRIWCASRHMEWQYHVQWKDNALDLDIGGLVILKIDSCISTGLTIGYNVGVSVHDLPPIKHHQLHKTLPSCPQNDGSTNANLTSLSSSRCLSFLRIAPAAMRARTPTSAGMWNVLWNGKEGHDAVYERGALSQEAQQEKLWMIAEARFGFSPEIARDLHTYLTTNMRGIAQDNLVGQCTQGHSCKESSKLLLEKIVRQPHL